MGLEGRGPRKLAPEFHGGETGKRELELNYYHSTSVWFLGMVSGHGYSAYHLYFSLAIL